MPTTYQILRTTKRSDCKLIERRRLAGGDWSPWYTQSRAVVPRGTGAHRCNLLEIPDLRLWEIQVTLHPVPTCERALRRVKAFGLIIFTLQRRSNEVMHRLVS